MSYLFKNEVSFKHHPRLLSIKKGRIIESFNNMNVIVSVLLAFLLFAFEYAFNGYIWLFTFIILIRVISRSLEIIIAFYKDVTHKNEAMKKTNLNKYDRISLAVKSYLEMIITYAIAYSVIGEYSIENIANISDSIKNFLDNLIVSVGTMTISDSNLTTYFNSDTSQYESIGIVK